MSEQRRDNFRGIGLLLIILLAGLALIGGALYLGFGHSNLKQVAVPPSASIASARRVNAAGGVPDAIASEAMPRERGSAAALFLCRGFSSPLLLGACFGALGSTTVTSYLRTWATDEYLNCGASLREARATRQACVSHFLRYSLFFPLAAPSTAW